MSEQISKDKAIAALRAHSWAPMIATCGHTGCEDHEGPDEAHRTIHTFADGFLGADWDLPSAETAVRDATSVGWQPNALGHDLVIVTAEGRRICFEAQPQPAESAVEQDLVAAAEHGLGVHVRTVRRDAARTRH